MAYGKKIGVYSCEVGYFDADIALTETSITAGLNQLIIPPSDPLIFAYRDNLVLESVAIQMPWSYCRSTGIWYLDILYQDAGAVLAHTAFPEIDGGLGIYCEFEEIPLGIPLQMSDDPAIIASGMKIFARINGNVSLRNMPADQDQTTQFVRLYAKISHTLDTI